MAGAEMEKEYCLCVNIKYVFTWLMKEFRHSLQQLSGI